MKWLDNYQKGRFEVTIDSSSLGPHLDRLNVSTERLMAGMILAGMLIGGPIALVSPVEMEIGAYVKLVVLIVFVFAALLGLWLTLRILWHTFGEERRLSGNKNPWK